MTIEHNVIFALWKHQLYCCEVYYCELCCFKRRCYFDFFFLQVLHHLVHQLGWPPLVTCLTAIFPSLSHWMYNHVVDKLLLMLHVNLEEVWMVINILLNWMVYRCTSLSKHPTWRKLLQRNVHILNSGIRNVSTSVQGSFPAPHPDFCHLQYKKWWKLATCMKKATFCNSSGYGKHYDWKTKSNANWPQWVEGI